MKKIIFFLLLLNLAFTSCKKDDDVNIEIEEPTPLPVVTATETCLLSDFNIQENSTISINCLLDLEGQTVNVPSGVTFTFDNGDIFNGTLNFTAGGQIDGELFNSDLIIEGDVNLTSDEFQFYPERWGIVEVDDPNNPEPPQTLEVAYNNHLIMQSTINLVKGMGATVFNIDKLNAYFDSMNGEFDYKAVANPVILVPSDFHLKMSENTYLRVFPISGIASSILIKIFRGINIKVSGGNLIGDRLTHGPILGQGLLFRIIGGKNVIVDGMNISLSSSTGLTIHGDSFLEREEYFGSEFVTIKNCVFDSNRANNLSVTDGQNITIQDNKSYNAGIDMESNFGTSPGIAPRIGIILETQVMQFIENVVIKGNTVENSGSLEGHDIIVVGATDIEVTDNNTQRRISWSTGLNVQIKNNTAGGVSGGFLGFNGINNIISGNTITTPDEAGIFLTDQNVEVFDNNLINCKTGIQVSSLLNTNIYNNNITSNVENSIGVVGQNYLNNVNIYDNDFNLNDGKPFNIIAINTETEHKDYVFTFNENRIISTRNGLTPGTSNMTIINNKFSGAGLTLGNANNITVKDNIITNNGDFVTFGTNGSSYIEITGNTFEATNDGPFSTSVTISSSIGSNIIFHNNIVKSLGINFGMNVNGADDVSIQNNTIQNESTFRPPLNFSGNNSEIIDNTLINSNDFTPFIIEGNNNIISGNN